MSCLIADRGWWGGIKDDAKILVSASGRMGFHYLRKAERSKFGQIGNRFLMCYL